MLTIGTYHAYNKQIEHIACADSERVKGFRSPHTHLENYKAKGFLSNSGLDPLENVKATKPAVNIGPLGSAVAQW